MLLRKSKVASSILDEEVLAVIAAIVIVASVLAIVQNINSGRVIEPFSELGILGPNMKIGDYPKEVVAGFPFKLYLYLGNYEGKSVYYRILIKLGNKTSIINETTPLNSTPIMEIRRILIHNSTCIYPLNITLYTPGINKRLIIEMWIYNETSKIFTYYGRWNQLWLNITSSLATIESQKFQEIPSEIDSLLTQGFLAVRKAESSGGNVSEMVSLLNEAIDYAQKGEYTKASSLINKSISLEKEVSRIGIENRNKQLNLSIITLSVIFIGSISLYSYLRKDIWIFWSKLKSRYIVKLNSRINKSENLIQNKIQELIHSNKRITVNELISNSKKFGIKSHEFAKELFKMTKNKVVTLEDPSPPKNFSRYIFSIYSLDFWIILALLSLTLISIYFSSFLLILYLRYILGSLFVLFLPGYSLIEALYPKKEELMPLERLALSIGLSLALVPLVGLFLNYTPFGIRLDPVVFSLTFLTLFFMLIASYRKYLYLKLSIESKRIEK